MTRAPSRPRTRKEAHAATRAALLDAARDAFAQRGYEGASLDFIVDKVGLTKGAVYSNFGGKEAMFLEVADRHFREAHAISLDLLGHAAGIESALDALTTRLEAAVAGSHLWSQLTAQLQIQAEQDPIFRARYAVFHQEQRRIVGKVVGVLYAKAGASPPWPVEDIGDTLMAIAVGLILQDAAVGRGPAHVAEQFRAVLSALLLAALGAEERPSTSHPGRQAMQTDETSISPTGNLSDGHSPRPHGRRAARQRA